MTYFKCGAGLTYQTPTGGQKPLNSLSLTFHNIGDDKDETTLMGSGTTAYPPLYMISTF